MTLEQSMEKDAMRGFPVRCSRCHRALTDPESIKNEMGPVCRVKLHARDRLLPEKLDTYAEEPSIRGWGTDGDEEEVL